MADILHRVGVRAPMAEVYRAISTIEGLSNWWTKETSGKSELNRVIEFNFRNDDGSIKGSMGMEVKKLETNRRVLWNCKSGPSDWVGTDITFDLTQDAEFVILIFGHRNWKEASESMAHCSTKWAVFLLSLRDYLETGYGRPAPNDIKIDNWN